MIEMLHPIIRVIADALELLGVAAVLSGVVIASILSSFRRAGTTTGAAPTSAIAPILAGEF